MTRQQVNLVNAVKFGIQAMGACGPTARPSDAIEVRNIVEQVAKVFDFRDDLFPVIHEVSTWLTMRSWMMSQ